MDSVLLQKQVRDNADELQSYLKDLRSWGDEMKRKESELQGDSASSKSLPPVRSKRKKPKPGKKTDKIPGHDYASWDKFDVDKACEDVDAESPEEDDLELPVQVIDRLKEEASYEKEQGNLFVKAQKWSEATACYSRAIKCYANDPIFYANRALCFLKTKDYRSAETDCTASLQLDESYVKAYQRRAAARVALGQLAEARADLEKVLEREPNNSASRSELYKVLKKLEAQGKAPAKTNSSLFKKSSKAVDPAVKAETLSATIAKPSDKRSKCSTNQGLVEQRDKGSPTCESKMKLVETVHKPPHLRSKKPLKRIAIMDHDGAGESTSLATKEAQGSSTLDTSASTGESECPSRDETSHLAKTGTLNNVVERTGSISISCQEPLDTREERAGSEPMTRPPPVPTSYLGFVSGWSKVQSCPRLKYLYLKQIRGLDFPKIFQDSLESGVLTDILSTLASEFTANGSAVYGYLLGLSRVRRFGSLALFMSAQDKTNVSKLLSYCESRQDCTGHEAAILRKLYEL